MIVGFFIHFVKAKFLVMMVIGLSFFHILFSVFLTKILVFVGAAVQHMMYGFGDDPNVSQP